jgi:hypothetical protein
MATAALTEGIAANLEEAAEATRLIDTRALGFFGGGMAFGLVVGLVFGYRLNREKIRADAFKQSEREVEQIREIYQQKAVAAQKKPTVDEIIEDRGYSVSAEEDEVEVEVVPHPRPLKPPVPVAPARVVQPPPIVKPSNMRGWNYDVELEERRGRSVYVIHEDERGEHPEYNAVAYTYYAEDDVLVGEDNRPLPHAQEIVGIDNLKFGHGTDDDDVVFVRNDKLGLEMEIERVESSYEREVLGIEAESESEIEHSSGYPQSSRRRKRRR